MARNIALALAVAIALGIAIALDTSWLKQLTDRQGEKARKRPLFISTYFFGAREDLL